MKISLINFITGVACLIMAAYLLVGSDGDSLIIMIAWLNGIAGVYNLALWRESK